MKLVIQCVKFKLPLLVIWFLLVLFQIHLFFFIKLLYSEFISFGNTFHKNFFCIKCMHFLLIMITFEFKFKSSISSSFSNNAWKFSFNSSKSKFSNCIWTVQTLVQSFIVSSVESDDKYQKFQNQSNWLVNIFCIYIRIRTKIMFKFILFAWISYLYNSFKADRNLSKNYSPKCNERMHGGEKSQNSSFIHSKSFKFMINQRN
jgi:hypothetical protein